MKKKINEAPTSVNPLLYSNTKFENIGLGTPSKDKINPSLLADIDKAAKSANVKVSITTAVSGHDSGTRHEVGNAVDIAKINGVGILSLDNAKKLGIYDAINLFVNELVKLGYIKNSESGNDKAVLTFGFKGHDNHVHVSRNSDGGVSSGSTGSTETEGGTTPPTEDYNANTGFIKQMLNIAGFKDGAPDVELTESIKRIKTLMK
jgi:hypothetical protein